MRLTFICCFVVCFWGGLKAQDRPVFFPEDIEATTLKPQCLCKPGVVNKSRSRGLELFFLHNMSSQLNEENGFPLMAPLSELRLQEWSLKLRYPLVNKEGFKLIGGILYRPEHYDFQKVGADYQPIFNYLNGKKLKSSGMELLLTKSWNETIYTSFRARSIFNGDYSGLINLDSRYAIYNLSGILGVKKSDELEWGIGLSFSHSFRNTLALPFFLYNRTFNDKWGIESILPAMISLRYNLSARSILLLGTRYNSRSYAVATKEDDPLIFNLNHSELRNGLTLEQQLNDWIWLDATVGFQYNFSTDFEFKENSSQSFQVEPGHRPYFKIGIFVSPPDSFVK